MIVKNNFIKKIKSLYLQNVVFPVIFSENKIFLKKFYILYFENSLLKRLKKIFDILYKFRVIKHFFRLNYIKFFLREGDLRNFGYLESLLPSKKSLLKSNRFTRIPILKFLNDKYLFRSLLITHLTNQFSGNFSSVVMTRTKIRNRILSKFNKSGIKSLLLYRTALEINYFQLILQKSIFDYIFKLISNKSYLEIVAIVNYLNRNYYQAKMLRNQLYKGLDDFYYKGFSGKSVLVLGPAVQNNISNIEESDFDVVVYINNLVSKICNNNSIKIAYFNSDFTYTQYKKILLYQDQLDFMVFKSFDDLIFMRDHLNKCNISKLKLIHSADRLILNFWLPMPMGLINILYDLTWEYPEIIHVSGFDMYTNQAKGSYRKDYSNNSPTKVLMSLRVHDAISNYLLVKLFRDFNVFTTDTFLDSILQMNVNEYAQQLDLVFNLK